MRAFCKVNGLISLLLVRALWRCSDILFFEVPPLSIDALLTELHSLLENVLQTIDHFEISCLRDLDCMADVLMGFYQSTFSKLNTEFNSDLTPCNFWAFPTIKRELQGKKFQKNSEEILQHVFEKWVQHCKKCIACQGRYFKKETVTAPPQSSDSE
jgi:hypothetical protein